MTETGSADPRPDIVAASGTRLTRLERAQIGFVRRTFEPGWRQALIRWCQRRLGSTWIHYCTRHLRHVHGLERLPPLRLDQSYLCVSNHRSFFDMYVVTAELVRRGLSHRIVFPVRSKFFYDSRLGLWVNGIMSFFAMYPPIFRERKQLALNLTSLEELAWLLRRGGIFAGLHPEGTRKKDDDPYTFLPAQRGVGKVIAESKVTVLPVFVNGLINDLPKQITSNFARNGRPIHVVFGSPIDFSDLFLEPPGPKQHRQIAERVMAEIGKLGEQEREIRARSSGEVDAR